MPKMSLQYVLDHADELAERFESTDVDAAELKPAAPMRELQAAVRARIEADQRIARAVAHARSEGWSWSDIGAALGMSTQAAHQRFRDVVHAVGKTGVMEGGRA